MLEPRESDVPALFLFLVVFPLVTYILLGKWSEVAKRKERITLLAQLASDEAQKAEAMAVASMTPPMSSSVSVTPPMSSLKNVSSLNNVAHECAQCFRPATTRCSQCKSVRYCSGKCQILHWRQGHKHDCQQPETFNSCSSPKLASIEKSVHESTLMLEDLNFHSYEHKMKQPAQEVASLENKIYPSVVGAHSPVIDASTDFVPPLENWVSCKSNRATLKRENKFRFYSEEASATASKESLSKHKLRNNDQMVLEGDSEKHNIHGSDASKHGRTASRSAGHGSHKFQRQCGSECINNFSLHSEKLGSPCEADLGFVLDGGNLHREGNICNDETTNLKCPEAASDKRSIKSKSSSHPQGSNGVASMGIMKMMGLKRSKCEKIKMLFPYEEFVKFFHFDVCDLSPRGLLNCGNSCYANAVLQCLTFTRPLVIYFLHRSHSRACCVRNWCLMCELEQHVMMLRENGGAMSPGRILSHMQTINCRMGDGSQEDAHEFLRLLVTSMQSICLVGLGGECDIDPRLQETTFIQQTFGGRLRSKVKCLRCHHESERYENIMDLTLEILGWVESLEDALTQFTTPEDLDGENMYRCGRCAAYVRAHKQLSIHEAPNILTVVLKRFQEGRYGKINKYITFPDMLDMVPYMTGTDDIPPLYALYGVVVHLDTLNASFSGHYVSYVKDLKGSWFRIDDTEVQPVPMSQVMSEGAYILFYMRSCPRPPRNFDGKASQQLGPTCVSRCHPKTVKAARTRQSKTNYRQETSTGFEYQQQSDELFRCANRNIGPNLETFTEGRIMEFSDVTSSDWSIFTSSDDASFTTDSTRDSFSTIDCTDNGITDPLSSMFNPFYAPEYSTHNSVACRIFSNSKAETRFVLAENSYVLDSDFSNPPLDRFNRQVSSPSEVPHSDSCSVFVNYGSSSADSLVRT